MSLKRVPLLNNLSKSVATMDNDHGNLGENDARGLAGDQSDTENSAHMTADHTPTVVHARDVVFMHSERYMQALSRLPVHSEREKMTFALLQALALDTLDSNNRQSGQGPLGMQLLAPTRATDDQLTRFHSKTYVDILRRTAEDDEADEQGGDQATEDGDATHRQKASVSVVSDRERDDHELVDDAYIFPGLYEYVGLVAGASLTAADALQHLIARWYKRRDGTQPAPVAINLGGGRHHAMRNEASGFCYVNDVVLAIQRLISPTVSSQEKRLQRVLCIDIDVHHGDGVQEAFFFSPNVTTVSFHLLERGFFPGTGAMDEIGVGRGKHHNINVPLRRGITNQGFHRLFDAVINRAMACIEPDAVVLICGVDTLARDPLGGFNMTSEGIVQCVRLLLAFDKPMLLLGGGGYSGVDACRAIAAVVASVACPGLDLRSMDVPEHDFYEQYAPDFKMVTKSVIHRPDQNTEESIAEVEMHAITTLERARHARASRGKSNKRKIAEAHSTDD